MRSVFLVDQAVGVCFGPADAALHISTLVRRKTEFVQFVFLAPNIVFTRGFFALVLPRCGVIGYPWAQYLS